MRIAAVIRKAFIMQLRDYWALLLTILSAPFFIFIYYVITSGGSVTYTVHYLYENTADSLGIKKVLTKELNSVQYSNGAQALEIKETNDTANTFRMIRDRNVDLMILFPVGFSDSLQRGGTADFSVFGEASNPKYSIALIFTVTGIENIVSHFSHVKPAYTFNERFLGNSQAKTEFDVYVPGIFIFSIIMLILSASLSIIRDVEDKTMIRLKLSRMTVWDYLGGNTVVQWFIGMLSFALTYGLAVMLGFQSQGAFLPVMVVCSLTILSVLAICLILIAFCKNAAMVMIVGNFPLFILMFFTGSMIPLPRHELFAGFAWNDILPPTHAVVALNKIFTFGATLKDIKYEIGMLLVLTFIYAMVGVYLFMKKHMKTT